MPIETRLFFNLTTEQFVQSFQQPSSIGVPRWYFGDVMSLRVQFFRNAAAGQGQVEVVSTAGISLQIGVARVPGTTLLTSATADPSDPDHIFSAELPLNVGAILTDLGTEVQRQYVIEFRTTESGLDQRYQGNIIIRNRVLDGSIADPPSGEVGLSMAGADARYWPRVVPEAEAGAKQYWRSANGTLFEVGIDDNGQWQITQLS